MIPPLQPPQYTNPQQYQQMPPQFPSYWTDKHKTGAALLGGTFIAFMFLFLLGFLSLGLAWCLIPFLLISGVVGLVMLF